MTTEQTKPLMIRGDRLLLAIEALRSLFEPVPGIDPERTRNAITRLLGLNPDHVLSGIVYAACQIDHDGTLRKVLRTGDLVAPGLKGAHFDAGVLLDDVKEGAYHLTIERLVVFFLAVACGDFTEADFREAP